MGAVMELKAYLSPMSPEQREAFANACGTTRGHLQNVMYGKSCAPDLAVAIELKSKGAVTRKELRADWPKFWPELMKKARA
jgi:DNA-binding transcriptional regulator YdaS (Cro superfamily)